VHFAVDAMAATEVRAAPVHERGDRQRTISRPSCCSALLVYSYASGVFSGPQIERTAQENLAVRVLCADTYPGRDTLRTFRRKNAPLAARPSPKSWNWPPAAACSKSAGSRPRSWAWKILANASKRSAVSYAQAGQTMQTLDVEIAAVAGESRTSRRGAGRNAMGSAPASAPPGKSPAAPDPTPATQD
jgi:hypothetical protein